MCTVQANIESAGNPPSNKVILDLAENKKILVRFPVSAKDSQNSILTHFTESRLRLRPTPPSRLRDHPPQRSVPLPACLQRPVDPHLHLAPGPLRLAPVVLLRHRRDPAVSPRALFLGARPPGRWQVHRSRPILQSRDAAESGRRFGTCPYPDSGDLEVERDED